MNLEEAFQCFVNQTAVTSISKPKCIAYIGSMELDSDDMECCLFFKPFIYSDFTCANAWWSDSYAGLEQEDLSDLTWASPDLMIAARKNYEEARAAEELLKDLRKQELQQLVAFRDSLDGKTLSQDTLEALIDSFCLQEVTVTHRFNPSSYMKRKRPGYILKGECKAQPYFPEHTREGTVTVITGDKGQRLILDLHISDIFPPEK